MAYRLACICVGRGELEQKMIRCDHTQFPHLADVETEEQNTAVS